MTKIQERSQADGPAVPTAERLALVLSRLPEHHEVRAISINGQTGTIVVESMHEGMDEVQEFEAIARDNLWLNAELKGGTR